MISKEFLMNWTPTEEHILAVGTLFAARAFHDTVMPEVRKAENDELECNEYFYDSDYLVKVAKYGEEIPANKRITDRKNAFLMEGLKGKADDLDPSYGYGLFHNRVDAVLKEKGLRDGANAGAVSGHMVTKAEWKLLRLYCDAWGVSEEQLSWNLKVRKEFIELICKMISVKWLKEPHRKHIETTSQALFLLKMTKEGQIDKEAEQGAMEWLIMEELIEPLKVVEQG